jgi:hypothetical protein
LAPAAGPVGSESPVGPARRGRASPPPRFAAEDLRLGSSARFRVPGLRLPVSGVEATVRLAALARLSG